MRVKEFILLQKNLVQWIRVLFLVLKKRLIIANIDCKLKEIGKKKERREKDYKKNNIEI